MTKMFLARLRTRAYVAGVPTGEVFKVLRIFMAGFTLVFLAPIAASASLYAFRGVNFNWQTADRSSAGLLSPAHETQEAAFRIFSARTVRWRGIFATHSWIVLKPRGASAYRRYDYTGWGQPIWIDRFVADGKWFGKSPEVVFAADGERAEAIITKVEKAIAGYSWRKSGDYEIWPGPNSNTFVAAAMAAAPEIDAVLPPTAIGKDYPFDGKWLGVSPSGTGFRLNLGGYAGLTIGWVEGVEINFLGAVAGIDIRRPALKLPAIGRIGMAFS